MKKNIELQNLLNKTYESIQIIHSFLSINANNLIFILEMEVPVIQITNKK